MSQTGHPIYQASGHYLSQAVNSICFPSGMECKVPVALTLELIGTEALRVLRVQQLCIPKRAPTHHANVCSTSDSSGNDTTKAQPSWSCSALRPVTHLRISLHSLQHPNGVIHQLALPLASCRSAQDINKTDRSTFADWQHGLSLQCHLQCV